MYLRTIRALEDAVAEVREPRRLADATDARGSVAAVEERAEALDLADKLADMARHVREERAAGTPERHGHGRAPLAKRLDLLLEVAVLGRELLLGLDEIRDATREPSHRPIPNHGAHVPTVRPR